MDSVVGQRGWLVKAKNKPSGRAFSGDTNRRFFTIETFEGDNGHCGGEDDEDDEAGPKAELALCYYKSPSSTDRCGWIFLSDVESLDQDAVRRWIEVRHPSRTYRLQAPDHAQHRQWFAALSKACTNATDLSADKEDGPMGYFDALAAKSSAKEPPNHETDGASRTTTELKFLREVTGKANDCTREEGIDSTDDEDELENKAPTDASASSRGGPDDESVGSQIHVPLPRDRTSLGGKYELDGDDRPLKIEAPSETARQKQREAYDHRLVWTERDGESTTNKRLSRAISESEVHAGGLVDVSHADSLRGQDIVHGIENVDAEDVNVASEMISQTKYSAKDGDSIGEDDDILKDDEHGDVQLTAVQPLDNVELFSEADEVLANMNCFAYEIKRTTHDENELTKHAPGSYVLEHNSDGLLGAHFDEMKVQEMADSDGSASPTNDELASRRSSIENSNGAPRTPIRSRRCHVFGPTPDKNFATEDWDDSSTEEEEKKSTENDWMNKALSQYGTVPKFEFGSPLKERGGVQPDENFLDDDWDEDST